MKLVTAWMYAILAGIFLTGTVRADNPVLGGICSNVDCLNNFTAKTGWSFDKNQLYAGGFTDLKQSWYVSPGPGFDVPVNGGPSTGKAILDVNIIFKIGQLLADKITFVHNTVNSDPFAKGLLKYSIIGESAAYNYTNGRWFDLTWAGFTVKY